jgi:F-type H+-transporting ATPase subunit gamma
MSGNLIDLRKRVKSVKNTQKITRAMKTVSAAKLRKSTTELNKNKSYIGIVESMLKMIGRHLPVQDYPFLKKRKEGDSIIVAVSSDKGLCGAFNSHIMRKAEEYYQEKKQNGENPVFIAVGNKVFRYLKKKEHPIKKSFASMMSKLSYEDTLEFSRYLQDIYLNENIRTIEFVYTQYLSASQQKTGVKRLFPLQTDWDQAEEEKEDIEFIYEPDPDKIFEFLLPKYLDTLLYRIMRESEASEQAARMIAMDLATRNASDMIKSLTLTMNKVRQAAITKELLEIITATEAMKK